MYRDNNNNNNIVNLTFTQIITTGQRVFLHYDAEIYVVVKRNINPPIGIAYEALHFLIDKIRK